jgi:UDP-2-acetamido-3-amino-2,3-dideoxy-glucuronate N-acetyltransferase
LHRLAVVDAGARVGPRTRVWAFAHVLPGAVFTNDLAPRSGRHPAAYTPTLLAEGCSIGANATVLAGRSVGRFALVGAGAVVTRDVPDFALVVGNPARLVGWVCRDGHRLDFDRSGEATCPCGALFRLASAGEAVHELLLPTC